MAAGVQNHEEIMTLDRAHSGPPHGVGVAGVFRFAAICLLLSAAAMAPDKSCVAHAMGVCIQESLSQVDAASGADEVQREPDPRTGAVQDVLMPNADSHGKAIGRENVLLVPRKRPIQDKRITPAARTFKTPQGGTSGYNGLESANWDATIDDPAGWVELSVNDADLARGITRHDVNGIMPRALGRISVPTVPVLFGDTLSATQPLESGVFSEIPETLAKLANHAVLPISRFAGRVIPLPPRTDAPAPEAIKMFHESKTVRFQSFAKGSPVLELDNNDSLALSDRRAQLERLGQPNLLLKGSPPSPRNWIDHLEFADLPDFSRTRSAVLEKVAGPQRAGLRMGEFARTPPQAVNKNGHASTVLNNDRTTRSQISVTEDNSPLPWAEDIRIRNHGQEKPNSLSVLLEGGIFPTYNLGSIHLSGSNVDDPTRTRSAPLARLLTYPNQNDLDSTTSQAFPIAECAQRDSMVTYWVGEPIPPLEFPAPPVRGSRYSLTPSPPPGLSFDSLANPPNLTGTPIGPPSKTRHRYRRTLPNQFFDHWYCIEVREGLRLRNPGNKEYYVGQQVSDTLYEAVSGVPPYEYELQGSLPEGLHFSKAERTIHGEPNEATAAPAPIIYTVTDALDSTHAVSFTIEVKEGLKLAGPVADTVFAHGEQVEMTLPEAHGGTGDNTYALHPEPPGDLEFVPGSRTLSGTATRSIPPTPYVYSATDLSSDLRVSIAFEIEVLLGLDEFDLVYFLGEHNSHQLPEPKGGDGPYEYDFEPPLPQGLAFDADTRSLSGTPLGVMDKSDFKYKVTDSRGARGDGEFTIEVKEGLKLAGPIADTVFAYGEQVAITLPEAHGGTGDYEYALSPEPPGELAFDPRSRTLNGTATRSIPPTPYVYSVTDPSSESPVSIDFQIEVLLGLDEIDLVYFLGTHNSHQLPEPKGGDGPYGYEFEPPLPQGLAFDPDTRSLSGKPSEVMDKSNFISKVSDAWGARGDGKFTIEVKEGLRLAGPIADTVFTYGAQVAITLPEAHGGTGDYEYALSPEPPGELAFDPRSRTLNGTATRSIPPTPYVYSVTDPSSELPDSVEFQIEVLLGLDKIAPLVYSYGEHGSHLLPKPKGGVDPYEFNFNPSLPPGLAFDNETRTLSGTPLEVMDESDFIYKVTDAAGARGEDTLSITVTANAALIRDRSALIALYEATLGPEWTDNTDWLSPPADVRAFTAEDLGKWYGVEVSDGRVTGVVLPDNNLQGALPEALGNLTALDSLNLQHNRLDGALPSALGQLSRLQVLLLHDNMLSGPIPPELGKLASLEKLHLQHNELTGEIPKELGAMGSLKQLWLQGNALSGTIPSELGRLDGVQGLLLSDNRLTGTIPPALGTLSALEDLWLQGNELVDAVPPELGQLGKLQRLLLSDNRLSGAIPSALGDLAYLKDLWLHNNQLSGGIPPDLGRLDSLQDILLHNNSIGGPIPAELGNLKSLRWLQLHTNELGGSVPIELGRLARLERLELSDNQLTGAVPESLGNLTELEHLYLDGNQLSGTLPRSLMKISPLKELFIHGPGQEVCAPDDEGFEAWLASLRAFRGPICGRFLTFTAPVSDRQYVAGQSVTDWTLPEVEGGTAPYQYTLHPALPAGLHFEAATRTVRGTPRDTVSATAYTYTASDGTGSTGRLTFTMTVVPSLADRFELHGNYPNPFTGTTRLEFSLSEETSIRVEVFDLLGRKVLNREAHSVPAGAHRHISLNTASMAPGLYLYRVQAIVDGQMVVRSGQMIRL
ncbi:MAG: putative Ig domain-containing protein [Bacteroidota bacterium]|nr:putative Ig domain-containing protein [Bacteroidota bacterium]